MLEGYVKDNQRTNGPVNAHLRSAVCTNVIENSPSIGADEALGPFFFRIINIQSIQVFPFKRHFNSLPIQIHRQPMLTLP